jgi:hypothetical protein
MMCCLLVLDSVTSTPQWIRQPRPRVYLKEGTYHTRLFTGTSTKDMKKCSNKHSDKGDLVGRIPPFEPLSFIANTKTHVNPPSTVEI